MVSLKTQIAGFSFDNCLMNAAGVSCMTVEELEEVRQSAAGTFITKTATLTLVKVTPSCVIGTCLSAVSIQWVCRIKALITIWITCLPFKRLSRNGHFFSHWSACRPAKHISCWKRCKTAGSTALPNSTYPAQTSPANRKSPTTLKQPR